MKNVIIIHGTEGYPEENWFPWLKGRLEARGYKVSVPQFPSPPGQAAKIDEWWAVFSDYGKTLSKDTIIIGHSLGGVFTLRILEKIPQPIKAAVFVGTPVGVQPILNYDKDKSFGEFSFDWGYIKTKAKHFIVFHSDNDPYVSLGNGEELAKNLNINLTFVPQAGHFNAKAGYTTFELLLEKLKPIL